eukprot:EG_transcript_37637
MEEEPLVDGLGFSKEKGTHLKTCCAGVSKNHRAARRKLLVLKHTQNTPIYSTAIGRSDFEIPEIPSSADPVSARNLKTSRNRTCKKESWTQFFPQKHMFWLCNFLQKQG